MGYKMIEITAEKQGKLMEHAEKAYEHVGKMLECIEDLGRNGMGQREGDGWYIRQLNRDRDRCYGNRDRDDDDYEINERRYGGRRYGMREGYPYYYPY